MSQVLKDSLEIKDCLASRALEVLEKKEKKVCLAYQVAGVFWDWMDLMEFQGERAIQVFQAIQDWMESKA